MSKNLNKLKELLICQVCGENEAVGVYSVPSVPISCAYCADCLAAGAHPWRVLVANTACIGSLDKCADWWKWMVTDTCEYLDRTLEEFLVSVQYSVKMMGIEMSSYPTKEEENMTGPGGPYE